MGASPWSESGPGPHPCRGERFLEQESSGIDLSVVYTVGAVFGSGSEGRQLVGLEHLLQSWSYLSYPEIGRALHPGLRIAVLAASLAALWFLGRPSC